MTRKAQATVHVAQYTGGLIGPSIPTLGPLTDGGTLIAETAPGCWGPMITPAFRGGHEVTVPVAVEGAEPGDALALRINKIHVTSLATASGSMSIVEGRYTGDPFVARRCPGCGAENPATRLEGIGEMAVRCALCGEEISPFRVSNGYTIVFDDARRLAVTLGPGPASELAESARQAMALPPASEQHPIVALCPADIPGLITRVRPFIGNLGTTPTFDMPDSHNAGDFGQFLIDAPHQYGIPKEKLEGRTDGHMDIDSVREGAVLICPVKVEGGGIYVGDVHAMQGDGEVAGHTTDVSAVVVLGVCLLKGLDLAGPLLLPPAEDLPPLARPLLPAERAAAQQLAARFEQSVLEESLPIQMVGTGANLNAAVDNGVERLARLLKMLPEEVLNRVTISGAVEIGRLPGVVTVTLRAPVTRLRDLGLAELVREQYSHQAAGRQYI